MLPGGMPPGGGVRLPPLRGPGLPCCAACAGGVGDDPAAGAVAAAAREAVMAAFEELRPALVAAVSAASLPSRREYSRAPSPMHGRQADSGADTDLPTRVVSNRSGFSASSDALGEAFVTRMGSKTSVTSGVPVKVQTLQANLAQALLEQSGFGLASRPGRRGGHGKPRRDADAAGAASGGSMVRVVPAPEPAPAHVDRELACTEAEAWSDRSHTQEAPPPLQGGPREEHRGQAELSPPSSSARRSERRHMSGSQVFKAQIFELSAQASSGTAESDGPEEPGAAERAVPSILLVFGILPWSAGRPRASAAYQWAMRCAVAVFVVYFFMPSLRRYLAALGWARIWPRCPKLGAMCLQREGFLSQVPLPLGAVIMMLSFAMSRHQAPLEETFALLQGVAVERGYEEWQRRQSRWDRAAFAFIWLCTVVATAASKSSVGESFGDEGESAQVFGHCVAVVLFSTVVLCLAYSMVCICRSLVIMIDDFCCGVVGRTKLQDIADVWNLTQAVLRRASNAVENGFLASFAMLAFTVPALLVDVGLSGAEIAFAATLPALFVTCGLLYVLLLASTISEQCSRVPALINAISFGPDTHYDRQRTVDYVASSAAGFYIFGMRLTTAMVVKIMYVWCIVVGGLFTRLGSSDDVSFGD